MEKWKQLRKSTGLVTLFNLLLRVIGLWSQTRLAELLGSEGLGLMQLSFSVEALAIAVATSGLRYSVTRLVSEKLSLRQDGEARFILRTGVFYALLCSLLAAALLRGFAPQLAAMAGDRRILPSLRIFAVGLPFLGLNAVFGGYFLAIRQPWKACLSQLTEQLVMTLLMLLLLPRYVGLPEQGCTALAFCGCAADLCSLLLSYILYICSRTHSTVPADRQPYLRRRMFSLSLTLAVSSQARTLLSTLQHLMVPRLLRKSGESAASALSLYGIVTGMVFPVIGFASVFFGAFSELLIPELTAEQIQGQKSVLEDTAGRVLRASLLLALCCAALLYALGPILGQSLYHSTEAGSYIRLLSPLVILMYLDSVVDGMLKGLGKQLHSMVINITDAALTLLGSFLLLPRLGILAYIGLLYLSEGYNFLLSYCCLRREIRIKLL